METDIRNLARNLVLNLLNTNAPTDEELREAVNDILPVLCRRHGATLDADELVRVLQAEFNIFQADAVSLDSTDGHLEWLGGRRESIEWRFWNRYVRYLLEEVRLPPLVLQRLDSTTQQILEKLEDPSRPGSWDRRGMVVGQVQSGKTGNYTGLICRAVDVGYRLVIVLAGMHNSLRSQTQLRLDEGFLGIDTQLRQIADADDGFTAAALGVGRLIGEHRLATASLTTSAESGDFGIAKAKSVGIVPGDYPVLLVVKKNTRILNNLREWLLNVSGLGDPKRIREFPVFVIDDEADNASINTKPEDDDPAKVNRAIRALLWSFERRAYIGYTATPFANIYIDPDVEHDGLGSDLFPRSFIEYLRAPTNYFGPARLFGTDPDESPLPLYREIDDSEPWLPDRHKNGHVPGPLPQSIRTAMRSFVLTRAARMARGETRAHNSMLIHVTRFTSVQDAVRLQVADELELLKSRIKFGDGNGPSIRAELKSLWDADFSPTTTAMPTAEQSPLLWSQIEPLLTDAVDPIVVKTINGTAKDALDYFEQRASGLNVIAIGGDKLSRGLTLDGLSVSYYLRASKAFDTLLQMGRWFGYRPGYEDLCRLWTSHRLWNAYRQVSVANEELIGEFEEMASRHLTPSEYGLKVQNSVEGMLVTAANKMRAGTGLRVGFAGAISETTVLLADAVTAKYNLGVVDRFVTELNADYGSTKDRNGNIVWRDVRGDVVTDRFFAPFTTADSAYKVNAQTIARYVRDRLQHDELTDWTVALMSNPGSPTTIGGHRIQLTTRSLLDNSGAVETLRTSGVYRIRRILSPSDETIDFSAAEVPGLLEATREAYRRDPGRRRSEPKIPSGPIVRHARPAERGLLLIYPLAPPAQADREAAAGLGKNLTEDALVGFAVSFPASPDAPAMDYIVNQRFLDELFGAGDDDDEE